MAIGYTVQGDIRDDAAPAPGSNGSYAALLKAMRDALVGGAQAATLLTSASRTGNFTTATQSNPYARGVTIILNVTALGSGATLNAVVQGLDPASGAWYTVLNSLSNTTVTGLLVLVVYPTVSDAPLPAQWRVSVSVTGGTPNTSTISIGANYHS